MELQNEKMLKDFPIPIFFKETKKILQQMEKSVCQICIKDGSKGTGFFSKILLPNNTFVPVFISNNHVINEKYLKEEKEIIIKMNVGDKTNIKKINIKNRLYYTNEEQDITIIEIKEKNQDNSYEFLEFDDNILKDDGFGYIGNSIYILHYPAHFEEDKVAVSYGIIKGRFNDKKFDFKHYCSTEYGSSGSPILNISNNKVIGIHKKRGTKEFNIGLFAHESIKNFINKYNNEKNEKLKITEIISGNKNKKLNSLFDVFKNLYNKKLISDIIPINKEDEEFLAYQLICKRKNIPSKIYKNWIPAWHGTDHINLESIIKYGLRLPKSELEFGKISPPPKVIPKNKKIYGINNWETAIFASPCIWGASRYSNPIITNYDAIPIRERYYCLIEVIVKPNSFTEHEKRELDDIYEVYCGNNEDYERAKINFKIYRISSEENIMVKSILFIHNYFTSDLLGENSQKQRQILKKYGFLSEI